MKSQRHRREDLAGVDVVMAAARVSKLPAAKRVVLVGNKISPGNAVTKKDGTVAELVESQGASARTFEPLSSVSVL